MICLQDMNVKIPCLSHELLRHQSWLLWKEKLVTYWVNQNYHFGVTVTSPIEGCHATLKGYL
jgi:hypothetical protein